MSVGAGQPTEEANTLEPLPDQINDVVYDLSRKKKKFEGRVEKFNPYHDG
jgi:hypothetical protein